MWLISLILMVCTASGSTHYSFIKKVAQELNTSQLYIYQDHCPESFLQQILGQCELSVALLSISRNDEPSQHFARMLYVSCVPDTGLPVDQLKRFRGERSIFYILSGNLTGRQALQSLLWQCYSLKILHVIAMLPGLEQFYYRFQPFPEFQVEQRAVEQRPFYMQHFPNMHLQPLLVLPDHRHPRSIIYTDWRTGAPVLAGSSGNFIKTLAWKLNATLRYPEQSKLSENRQIDVPMKQVILIESANLSANTYPLELSRLCLMIPLAQPIPTRDIYLILANWQHILIALAITSCFGFLLSLHRQLTGHAIGWVDFILHDGALRGVLGQSFRQPLKTNFQCSLLYLMLGFLGLNLSTVHQAALGTMLTQPPKHYQPRTFADLERVNLPLMVNVADVGNDSVWDQWHMQVKAVQESEYDRNRDNMNMSHAYVASRLKWNLLDAQQKYFPREVFLYSVAACFESLVFMGFHLPGRSWFLEPLNKLILDVRANGLYQHWFDMNFFDMVAAGLISFGDPVERPALRIGGSLQFADLQWIWLGHAALLGTAAIVFVLEIIVKKLQMKHK